MERPRDPDKNTIGAALGHIPIDLGEQTPNRVLMRAGSDSLPPTSVRLILSPMESGRPAVGVIQST